MEKLMNLWKTIVIRQRELKTTKFRTMVGGCVSPPLMMCEALMLSDSPDSPVITMLLAGAIIGQGVFIFRSANRVDRINDIMSEYQSLETDIRTWYTNPGTTTPDSVADAVYDEYVRIRLEDDIPPPGLFDSDTVDHEFQHRMDECHRIRKLFGNKSFH